MSDDLMILLAIHRGAIQGQGIRDFAMQYGRALHLTIIYRKLQILSFMGLVEETSDCYKLTPLGLSSMTSGLSQLDSSVAKIMFKDFQ